VGQERSHPYGKAVLAVRASSPPAVQGSRVVVATALSAGSTACNPGGSAAQPPLQQGSAGGQGQLAACSAGLSRRRGDSFGGSLNGLQKVGQQRSLP